LLLQFAVSSSHQHCSCTAADGLRIWVSLGHRLLDLPICDRKTGSEHVQRISATEIHSLLEYSGQLATHVPTSVLLITLAQEHGVPLDGRCYNALLHCLLQGKEVDAAIELVKLLKAAHIPLAKIPRELKSGLSDSDATRLKAALK